LLAVFFCGLTKAARPFAAAGEYRVRAVCAERPDKMTCDAAADTLVERVPAGSAADALLGTDLAALLEF
jgi:hypothetical protein